jgi:hypothetical protein
MELQNLEWVWWIGLLATLAMAIVLIPEISRFVITIRLYKHLPVLETVHTALFSIRHQGAVGFCQVTLMALVFLGIPRLIGLKFPLLCYVPCFLAQLFAISRDVLPPSVLLLATSRREAVNLHTRLERGIWPYRIVLLLDPGSVARSRHSTLHWMGFTESNLRQPASKGWQVAVRQISETVPFIVLDARVASPAIIEEIEHIFVSTNHHTKTVVVGNDDGAAPAVEAAGLSSFNAKVDVIRATDVVRTLKRLGLTRTSSPDEVPIVGFQRRVTKIGEAMQLANGFAENLHRAIMWAEAANGATAFIVGALKLQRQLDGSPGDGALEVLRDLEADIAETEGFLATWSSVDGPENHEVIKRLAALHGALCKLRREVDATPPHLLDINEKHLRSLRSD